MLARPLLLLLSLLVSSSAFGGRIGWRGDAPLADELQVPQRTELRRSFNAEPAPQPVVDLIVEFRERAVQTQMDREAVAARGEAVRVRADELRDDLAAFHDERIRVGRTFSRVLFGAAVRVPRERVPDVAKLPYVAKVHLARSFEAFGERGQLAPAVARVRASGSGGAGVTVAVIDTGIDYTHPALGGGFGPGFKVASGWDFVNDDADPVDDHGHGTHVAGIIAADGAGLTGVAPAVTLVAFKVLARNGSGSEEDILAAIERAVDPNQDGDLSDRVDIVNMSLGGPARDDDPVANAVDRATAAGVLFSIAMGNSGEYGAVPSPALAPSAISVGAISQTNQMAWWSTRGPSYDYSIKPEVVAPGVAILSSVLQGKTAEASGTSMAAPYVAGVAALVKARHRDWSPAAIKSAVVTTARTLEEDVMVAGAGRVDREGAPAAALLAQPPAVSFGRVDAKSEVWTATRTVTLRNIADTAQTLTASVTGLREGVAVSVTPASVTLQPGESKTVEIALSVTNAHVPAPKEGSMSFGGQVQWSGGSAPVHVPWGFVKAGFVTIENPEGGLVYATILGPTRKYTTWEFLERTRVFWPLEKVDVILTRFTIPRVVAVAEEVDVEGAATASLSLASATISVPLATFDERGVLLSDRALDCQERVALSFPSGQRVSFYGAPDYRPHFTPVSERVKVYLMHTCGDVAASAMYAAFHEPLRGLKESFVSMANPRWLRQDLQFTPDVPRDQSMIGALAMMRFPGPNDRYYAEGSAYYLMRRADSKLRILFNKSPDPEVDLVAITEWWGRCWNEDLGHPVDCSVVDNIFLYLNDRTVTAETDLFLDVSPMGYTLPIGETMTFGRAPSSPQVRVAVNPTSWGTVAHWMGPLGERILDDTTAASIALYDASGVAVASGKTGLLGDEGLAPGRYRIESVDPQPVIGPMRGKATFTAWIDTRNGDAMMPFFSGLRVENAGARQASVVERGERATLLFAVADMTRGRVFFDRVPPDEEKTRVEYRAHGAAEWSPLPALVAARHYPFSTFLNGGAGTMYRVDLAAVTAAIDGPVDLRIYAEDTAGNSAEVTLEPAFWVGAANRRRTVRK